MTAAASPPKPIDWGWSSRTSTSATSPAPSPTHHHHHSNSNSSSAFINHFNFSQNYNDGHFLNTASTPTSSTTSASPPIIELQFLPPANPCSSSSSSQIPTIIGIGHEPSPSSAPPRHPNPTTWTIDPSRLKQLMMGSVTTTATTTTTTAPPASSSYPSSNGYAPPHYHHPAAPGAHHGELLSHLAADHRPQSGASSTFFDIPGSANNNKPLPSGWERCLDLKSGEIYIKKVDATANTKRVKRKTHYTHHQSLKDRNRGLRRESLSQVNNGHKQDWSHGWDQGRPTSWPENPNDGRMGIFECDREMAGSLDREPLSLDLDLRLTNEKRTRLSLSELTTPNPQSSKYGFCSPQTNSNGVCSPQSTIREWKWRKLGSDVISSDKPSSNIQEMVGGSTMTTALCSRCVMYVLMKKSNPTCPRCSNPVILDCSTNGVMNVALRLPPVSKKRPPSLELSPDDLSLSTDSSR